MAKLAEKIRVEEKISYREALLKSKNMVNHTGPGVATGASTVQRGLSTSTANNNAFTPQQAASTTLVDSSTSTDDINTNNANCSKCIDREELIKGFAIIITKLFYERDNCTDFSKNVSETIRNVLNFEIPPEALSPSGKRKLNELMIIILINLAI